MEELGYDWEAADDDSSGELSGSPQAHADHVIGYVRRQRDLPGVVSP